MKIERTPKQTPEGAPQGSPDVGSKPSAAGGLERMVWEELAPRLLHPTKLAFIQLLLEAGEPLALAELAEATKIVKGHAEQHCRKMQTAGVLEVVAHADGKEGEEPFYFFPKDIDPTSTSPTVSGSR